jgi:predicted unusual protein kinase regulating ubiquinone biosynthesis (AarF/ABC1/UbiB family)
VVVKIQRPGVAGLVHRDLRILRRLARTAEAHTDCLRSQYLGRR